MASPPGSYVERMVSVRDVAWFRNPDGSYTVTWTEDGVIRTEIFRTERGALRFARMLDTAGSLPTEEDIVRAEAAIRELEAAAFPSETASERRARLRAERSLAELESEMRQEEAEGQLGSLEPYMRRPRRDVPIRKHQRRSA